MLYKFSIHWIFVADGEDNTFLLLHRVLFSKLYFTDIAEASNISIVHLLLFVSISGNIKYLTSTILFTIINGNLKYRKSITFQVHRPWIFRYSNVICAFTVICFQFLTFRQPYYITVLEYGAVGEGGVVRAYVNDLLSNLLLGVYM